MSFARVGAASPGETRLRLALVLRGVPEPELQMPIETAVGTLHACTGWRSARFVAEHDGFDPHRSREAFERDRWALFRDAGYEVRIVTSARLRRPDELAADVLRLLVRPPEM